MGSALFTGVSGLQAFQRSLDVIANNIANVNTTGYRGSRTLFQDLFSQTIEGSAAPDGAFGGKNASQVGLGVRVGTIDINMGQGTISATGINTDLAIQGNGFFVLADGNGERRAFSRDGSFGVNSNGFLIDPGTGMFVQGFTADVNGVIDSNSGVGSLQIPIGADAIVRATQVSTISGNLSADATSGDALAVPPIPPTVVNRTVRVFDSLGIARDIDLTFTKVTPIGGDSAWEFVAEFDGTVLTAPPGTLTFNTNGDLIAATGNTLSVDLSGMDVVPETPFVFDLDFGSITELAGSSEVTNPRQDGFAPGVLEAFNIGAGGVINGTFSNGLTRVLGQVALASFSNPGGLIRQGDNLFLDQPGSGLPQIGTPNTGGRGTINGGVLEGSNVDLGTEFSKLIVTQRGFQANARTITAADTLLQETVNLIR